VDAEVRNRGGYGQMVLHGDGHVDLARTPFAGARRDNIYTYGPSGIDSAGLGIEGPPSSADDTVLLPVAQFDPVGLVDPWTRVRRLRLALNTVWYALLALVIALTVWWIRPRGERVAPVGN